MMPDDEHHHSELSQDAKVSDNLLNLLRLLAKEVAHRLACMAGDGDVGNRPRPK
jgi:hypothetical protein